MKPEKRSSNGEYWIPGFVPDFVSCCTAGCAIVAAWNRRGDALRQISPEACSRRCGREDGRGCNAQANPAAGTCSADAEQGSGISGGLLHGVSIGGCDAVVRFGTRGGTDPDACQPGGLRRMRRGGAPPQTPSPMGVRPVGCGLKIHRAFARGSRANTCHSSISGAGSSLWIGFEEQTA